MYLKVLSIDLLLFKISFRIPYKIASETWAEIQDREEKLLDEMYEFFLKRKKDNKKIESVKKVTKKKPASKVTKKATKKVAKK
jgi:hypothetical protein